MIIYFRYMRNKDLQKQEAIINATVDLVNEIGFGSSSVSKIARKANVSPATLYIYYENKEDLLVSTYIEIKKKMSKTLLKNFDNTQPFRDILFVFWKNGFEFTKENGAFYQYSVQFSHSPYSDLVDHRELEKHFEPLIQVLQKGIEQKVIKNVPFEILVTFIFYPIMILSNPKMNRAKELDNETVESAFNLAWDAIKL